MMKVYLDSTLVADAGQSLASALDAVRAQAGPRLVIDAQADGSPVPPDHLAQPPANAPYAQELRFTSVDGVALVRESLLEAADLLPPAREEHKRLADQIASSETDTAMQRLAPVLGVWRQVMDTLQAVRSCTVVSIPALSDESQEVDAAASRLNDRLVELRTAIRNQDWSALSDILCFDLVEEADRWESMLITLARSVEHADPTD